MNVNASRRTKTMLYTRKPFYLRHKLEKTLKMSVYKLFKNNFMVLNIIQIQFSTIISERHNSFIQIFGNIFIVILAELFFCISLRITKKTTI